MDDEPCPWALLDGERRLRLDEPCPTVLQHGRGFSGFTVPVAIPGEELGMYDGKPAYVLPAMREVREMPWNGFTVASTFSGCGGSSLGYSMAGFKVRWANEFIRAARDCYRANMSPTTFLNREDIRNLTPERVLDEMGMEPGELDLLDGSPPCASFSTAGKRQAGWGEVKTYSDTEQRTDDLFLEYVRLLRVIRPRTFVAENVSGLVKGTAKGWFLMILAALKESGYKVSCRVLDAQWLGVPQCRQRTIFVGVREDLRHADGSPVMPCHPSPLPFRYSVRDALPYLFAGTMQGANSGFGTDEVMGVDVPCPTVGSSPSSGNGGDVTDVPSPTVLADSVGTHWIRRDGDGVRRKFTIEELKAVCSFPADFIMTGTYAQRWERLGRAVPPVMMMHVARAVLHGCLLPAFMAERGVR